MTWFKEWDQIIANDTRIARALQSSLPLFLPPKKKVGTGTIGNNRNEDSGKTKQSKEQKISE